MFSSLQDSKSSFAIMSQCLQDDVEVSKNTLLVVLQLLVKDGDPQLVLELFNLYKNSIKSNNNNKIGSNKLNNKGNDYNSEDNNISEKKSKTSGNGEFVCTSYSSAIYNPVLYSLGINYYYYNIYLLQVITIIMSLLLFLLFFKQISCNK